jgi:hypothetical protein
LFQLLIGHAEVLDLLRLSNDFGESYARTTDPRQTRSDEASYRWDGSAAFAGVADGIIAGAGDDCPVLAGDGM